MKPYKPYFHALIYLVVATSSLYSQDKSENNIFKIIDYTWLEVGSNYSWYKNSIGSYNLNNYESDCGLSFQYEVGKFINLKSSLMFGLKIKNPYIHRFDLENRNLDYKKPIPEPLYAFFEIDRFDRLLSHNYYYTELPISIGFTFYQKVDLNIGFKCRYYFPQYKDEELDFVYNNKFENGLISEISYNLNSRFMLQCKYFFAIKPLFESDLTINDKQYISEFRNRAVQLNLLYKFTTVRL